MYQQYEYDPPFSYRHTKKKQNTPTVWEIQASVDSRMDL
jgi:hypothetical protein